MDEIYNAANWRCSSGVYVEEGLGDRGNVTRHRKFVLVNDRWLSQVPCMCVCIHVCMYVYVCMYVCIYLSIYECMNIVMYVFVYLLHGWVRCHHIQLKAIYGNKKAWNN